LEHGEGAATATFIDHCVHKESALTIVWIIIVIILILLAIGLARRVL
jgi:hypothetical protein